MTLEWRKGKERSSHGRIWERRILGRGKSLEWSKAFHIQRTKDHLVRMYKNSGEEVEGLNMQNLVGHERTLESY